MDIEAKLRKYHGYEPGLLEKWCSQFPVTYASLCKTILNCIEIVDARDIRRLLRHAGVAKKALIETNTCFICKFGPVGKSGEILIYEFSHALKKYKNKIIESWEIPRLPEGSTILFLDDLLGTGAQSSTYITDKLNQVLNPSHNAYLLCLFATPQGIKQVEDTTNVTVMACSILGESSHQCLNPKCDIFPTNDKRFLTNLNSSLHDPSTGYYANFGLLLAFYFAVPNNTMPIIWKHGARYSDESGTSKTWCALLPRDY